MPNKKNHSEVGKIMALQEYKKWIKARGRPFNYWEAQSCMVVGSKAAELPDILEPGTSPNHRHLAHSHELNFLLCLVLENLSSNNDQEFSNLLWRIGLKGYRSHLSMDQRTPMGLHSVIGSILARFIEKIAG